jgi:hypothetical protein
VFTKIYFFYDKLFKVFSIVKFVKIIISIIEVFLIGDSTVSSIIDIVISFYLVCVIFVNELALLNIYFIEH